MTAIDLLLPRSGLPTWFLPSAGVPASLRIQTDEDDDDDDVENEIDR